MSDTSCEETLLSIKERTSRIGVIGLGYVGLPVSVLFAEVGFPVLGFDIDRERVEMINAGCSYIGDVSSDLLSSHVQSGHLSATTDFKMIGQCDVCMICVPTPFTKNKNPDLSFVLEATKSVAGHLRKGQLVVLRSTTFPETTEKTVLPVLEKTGLAVGKDFWLAFSPERVDPGNDQYTVRNTPVVVGGVTPECGKVAKALFMATSGKVIAVSSPRVAEMSKLLENIFRSVNIALVNELARLCDRMGNVDIWEVIEAASTKPFGFMSFYPGPGIGGHCIPVDPYYLSWKAREYDFHTNFIELAAETNEEMPYYVVGKVIEELSDARVLPTEARVLVLGTAFKRDIGDTRNSPAIRVIGLLSPKVQEVIYNDPYVPNLTIGSRALKSAELTEDLLRSVDCVLITTDHSCYDYKWIARLSKLIVDTRNAMRGIVGERIVRLGAGPSERV